jgi:hypothetical protein
VNVLAVGFDYAVILGGVAVPYTRRAWRPKARGAMVGIRRRAGRGTWESVRRITALALEVNDLVRGSQQCSVASPQLCALVEVPAGVSVGVGGS